MCNQILYVEKLSDLISSFYMSFVTAHKFYSIKDANIFASFELIKNLQPKRSSAIVDPFSIMPMYILTHKNCNKYLANVTKSQSNNQCLK